MFGIIGATIGGFILSFIIWAIRSALVQDQSLKDAKEIRLDNKDLLTGFGTAWNFDNLEMKGKDVIKDFFGKYYIKEDQKNAFLAYVSSHVTLFLIVDFFTCILVMLSPIVLNVFTTADVYSKYINLVAFVLPVIFALWFFYWRGIPKHKRRYQSGYGETMYRDLSEIQKAIDLQPKETDLERQIREALSDSNTIIHGDVVHGNKIVGDVIRGNVIVNGKPQDK